MTERRHSPTTDAAPAPVAVQESAAARYVRLEGDYVQGQQTMAYYQGQRERGVLSRDAYIDLMMLADSQTAREREMAEAQRAMTRELAHHDADAAQQHHDGLVDAVADAADRIFGAIAAVQGAIERFEALYTQQQGPIWQLSSASGQPAFDIPSARAASERLIAGLPLGSHLLLYLFEPTAHPLTVGECRRALDPVPGCRPFSTTALRRHKQGFEYE